MAKIRIIYETTDIPAEKEYALSLLDKFEYRIGDIVTVLRVPMKIRAGRRGKLVLRVCSTPSTTAGRTAMSCLLSW